MAFILPGDLHSITAKGRPFTKITMSGTEFFTLPLNFIWLAIRKSYKQGLSFSPLSRDLSYGLLPGVFPSGRHHGLSLFRPLVGGNNLVSSKAL